MLPAGHLCRPIFTDACCAIFQQGIMYFWTRVQYGRADFGLAKSTSLVQSPMLPASSPPLQSKRPAVQIFKHTSALIVQVRYACHSELSKDTWIYRLALFQ